MAHDTLEPGAMRMSPQGLRRLTQWEGFRTRPYRDVAGLPTIGVGHLLTADELASGRIEIDGEPVRYADGLTEAQVQALLAQDLRRYEAAVCRACGALPLTQHQFDALVSFCFNVGVGAFNQSSLLRELRAGNFADVPDELRRWTVAGGQPVPGLAARREGEIGLWLGEA